MASDSDIRLYTGLSYYATCVSLYNFVKPRPGFNLNYYNGYEHVAKHPSNVVWQGRPRNMCEMDELFHTLTGLRLGLLEKDLAHRHNITQPEVSLILGASSGSGSQMT